jgi:hypothetical protein
MSWHRVIIKNSEDANLSAQGLMIPFMKRYKEAGTPEGVSVYISRNDVGDRTYYFSSNASSIAKDLLHTFEATRCFAEPNLDRFRKIRL